MRLGLRFSSVFLTILQIFIP